MSTSFWAPVGANQDQTFRVATFDNRSVAYAATLAVKVSKHETLIQVAQLTGAMTINVNVGSATTGPYVGDVLEFIFTADGTNRTVTLGTGFAYTASTVVVTASKAAYISFIFNGTAWQEKSRAITA